MGKQKLNQRALLKFLLDSSEDEGRRGSKREVSDDEDVGAPTPKKTPKASTKEALPFQKVMKKNLEFLWSGDAKQLEQPVYEKCSFQFAW
jgi:hypothetical protein